MQYGILAAKFPQMLPQRVFSNNILAAIPNANVSFVVDYPPYPVPHLQQTMPRFATVAETPKVIVANMVESVSLPSATRKSNRISPSPLHIKRSKESSASGPR